MSKPTGKTQVAVSIANLINSYSIAREGSGYFITKHIIQDGKEISSEKVSEPDVLAICMATLEKMVRKANGL